jgi:DNA repair protein RadC
MPAKAYPLPHEQDSKDQTVYGSVSLRELDQEERPQERLERLGAAALADRELLAMMLRSGSAKLDVMALSDHLLREAGSLSGMMRWTAEDFKTLPGIGKVKALQLTALMELAKRIARSEREKTPILDSPEKIFHHLYPEAQGLAVEKFWVLCLDRKNRLMKMEEITTGTADASLVHPREVFQAAIRRGACGLIAVHNHPSGDPTPSAADVQVTRSLRDASKIVQIDLLDHVVMGDPSADPRKLGYYSFHDAGMI